MDGWGGDCSGRVSVCHGVDVEVREKPVPVEQSVVGYGHELEPVMSVELLLVPLALQNIITGQVIEVK